MTENKGHVTDGELEEKLIEKIQNKGHVHAESHAEYSKDMFESEEPWKRWEVRNQSDDAKKYHYETDWEALKSHPSWSPRLEYRRKPQTKKYILELPEPMKEMPLYGQVYWHISYYNMVCSTTCNSKQFDFDMFEKGLCFATEADAQEFLDVLKNRQPATE